MLVAFHEGDEKRCS